MTVKDTDKPTALLIVAIKYLMDLGVLEEFRNECALIYGQDIFTTTREEMIQSTLETYNKLKGVKRMKEAMRKQ